MLLRMRAHVLIVTGVWTLVLALAGNVDAYRPASGGIALRLGHSSSSAARHYELSRTLPPLRRHVTRPLPSGFRRAFRVPPAGHRAFSLRGGRYISYGGRFFLNTPGGFQPVSAPVGATLATLPVGYVTVDVQSTSYFYHSGTFFRRDPGHQAYLVVAPPVGATVPSIPPGYAHVYIDSRRYYKLGEVYYRSFYRRGIRVFEVVDID